MNTDIVTYYQNRAKEYEKVYLKPERQKDLLQLTQLLQQTFQDQELLELACGTGYWTERIAQTAKVIRAIDINAAVLEIARAKTYAPAKVSFEKADLYQLPSTIQYSGLFGGFIWSHIPLQGLSSFIDLAHRQVKAGGTILFIDNRYVEGSSLPLTTEDSFGNTYQTRRLENGSTYQVLKNFPSQAFLERLLKDKTSDLTFIGLEYYWVLQYKRH